MPTALGWTGDRGAFVDQLARRGIALLHDCGVEHSTVREIGNTIGFVRETNYGSIFDVIAEPDPVNLAYTPLGLPAHTDNPYRDPCPTVQLLHCLAAASEGGAGLHDPGGELVLVEVVVIVGVDAARPCHLGLLRRDRLERRPPEEGHLDVPGETLERHNQPPPSRPFDGVVLGGLPALAHRVSGASSGPV